jgi:hypothetical protein
MEMVNQMFLRVPDETLQSNNGVCATKIKMQRIMSYEKRNEPLICQSEYHCSNITQQTGHFTAPYSIVGFNAP